MQKKAYLCSMKRIPTALAIVAVIAAFSVSCNREKLPEGVMDEARMVDFLTEAYKLESFYVVECGFKYDIFSGEIVATYDSLMAAQGVTREAFERSIDYYSHHPEAYESIHNQVVSRLDDELSEIQAGLNNK